MATFQEFLDALKELSKNVFIIGMLNTLLLIVVVLILRWLLARSIRRMERLPKEIRRRWLIQVRNAAFLLILLGTVVIWAEELRLFAVSLLAVAVACVIATKELIQCFSGSVLKASSRSFTIGDRIEVANLRGDVIDMKMLTTTILEIGPNELTQQLTGRAISIPNSVFLDKPVINESFTDEFVLHVFKVPVKLEDWQVCEQDLLAAANVECASHLEESRKHFSRLGENDGIFTASIEPRISFSIPKAGELELVVRVPTPARKKGRIEQAILRRFLTLLAERRQAESENESAEQAPTDDQDSGQKTDSSV